MNKLRELALKAPQVVYDNETESGRFYNAANPTVIIQLLDRLKSAEDALEMFAYRTIPNSNSWRGWEAIADDSSGNLCQFLAGIVKDSREHFKKWSDTDDTK